MLGVGCYLCDFCFGYVVGIYVCYILFFVVNGEYDEFSFLFGFVEKLFKDLYYVVYWGVVVVE